MVVRGGGTGGLAQDVQLVQGPPGLSLGGTSFFSTASQGGLRSPFGWGIHTRVSQKF